jgi:thioredoxin-related protein
MYFRRRLAIAIAGCLVLAASLVQASNEAASPLMKSAHGLYVQPWFQASTGDLQQDMAAAQKAGKVLAVFWEQDGCHYCQEMHEVNLRNKEIVDYITRNFHVIQYDLHGQDEAKGWDGVPQTQGKLAGTLGVRGTPTVLFYRESGNEVTRLPGYAKPAIFKKVFEYVVEKGDKEASLIDWIRAKLSAETKG